MPLPPFPRPRITPDMLPREVWPTGRALVFVVAWALLGALALAGLVSAVSAWM